MPGTANEIQARFHDAMMGIYDKCLRLPNPYKAGEFRKLVARVGGKAAADQLLDRQDVSYGFSELVLRGSEALKLSVEYLVLQYPWRQIFSPAQLRIARERLRAGSCPLPPEDEIWNRLDEALKGLGAPTDQRAAPDSARHGAFKRGWRDATDRAENYAESTLKNLTWQNLGFRLGKTMGPVNDSALEAIFAYLSSRWYQPPDPITDQPTADREEFDRRVTALLTYPNIGQEPPKGNPHPPRIRSAAGTESICRDPMVAAWVLIQANGVCELCKMPAPFVRVDGSPYLEVHHAKPLGEFGPDTIDNCVALCPNCHRRCHHSADRGEATKLLYALVARLRPCAGC